MTTIGIGLVWLLLLMLFSGGLGGAGLPMLAAVVLYAILSR